MQPTIAEIAAWADRTPDHRLRGELDALALDLIRVSLVRREVRMLSRLLCLWSLDAAARGGEDERRDSPAA